LKKEIKLIKKDGDNLPTINKNHAAFCCEYIKNGKNGTKAYLKIYKTTNKEAAGVSASKLLRNAKVIEYIESLQEKLEQKALATAGKIIKELETIAFEDRTKIAKLENKLLLKKKDGTEIYAPQVVFTETDSLTKKQKKIISSYKQTKNGITFETYDKMEALKLLGKYLNLFKETAPEINNNFVLKSEDKELLNIVKERLKNE